MADCVGVEGTGDGDGEVVEVCGDLAVESDGCGD